MASESAPGGWHYSFRAGDHLIYSQKVERQASGRELEFRTRAEYTNHVLVVASGAGRHAIGFQRNRTAAELLAYKEKGKDKLKEETPKFVERMAKRDARFVEANELTLSGTPLSYWSALREVTSRLIPAVHEIEALPDQAVKTGDTWPGANLLNLTFKVLRFEGEGPQACAVVEGTSGKLRGFLRYRFCPEKGVLEELEFQAEYEAPGTTTVHEHMTLQLREHRRDEKLADWLAADETQNGALFALLSSEWAPVSPETTNAPLASADTSTQTMALALLYRRNLKAGDAARLRQLSNSNDVPVRELARRLLEPQKTAVAGEHGGPIRKPGVTIRATVDKSGHGAIYGLSVPLEYRGDKPFPLVVYLSGGAGRMLDAVQSSLELLRRSGYIVLYPDAGLKQWWTAESAQKILALLDEVQATMNVDASRIYIAGFSNGGSGALYYSATHPQRIAAMVSLMGAGQCLDETSGLDMRRFAEMAVLIVHGDKDTVIPDSCSRDLYKSLQKAGNKQVRLEILKGRGHDITLDSDDGLTLRFLEALQPRQVAGQN